MGVSLHVDFDKWPRQGSHLNRRAEVCFRYDTKRVLMGTIVRDDNEGDGTTIIKLDDGRYVLGTECQYSPIYGSATQETVPAPEESILKAFARSPRRVLETIPERQREPDAIEKQALYGNMRELYRRDPASRPVCADCNQPGELIEFNGRMIHDVCPADACMAKVRQHFEERRTKCFADCGDSCQCERYPPDYCKRCSHTIDQCVCPATMQIDTADTVQHIPTGETWTVAYVKDGRLAWVGWPQGEASLEDCELVRAATDEQRLKLLNQMAEMNDQNDPRCRFARWRLGQRT